jgi:hypothetical protein
MDWVKTWMQRILDMDLQFTRQRYGYQQLGNLTEGEGGDNLRKELENWEEDKLVSLIQD